MCKADWGPYLDGEHVDSHTNRLKYSPVPSGKSEANCNLSWARHLSKMSATSKLPTGTRRSPTASLGLWQPNNCIYIWVQGGILTIVATWSQKHPILIPLGIRAQKSTVPHAMVYPISSVAILYILPILWQGSCSQAACFLIMEG